MYFRQSSNQYITENTPFTIDGIQYPPSWLDQATAQDKANLGLVKVQVVGEFKDGKYYNNSELLNGATLTITSTAKPLADVKKQAITDVNATAYSILFPTDYMPARAFETGVAMLPAWVTWRASIRTAASNAVTAINAATTVDAVANVMANIVWPTDPNNEV